MQYQLRKPNFKVFIHISFIFTLFFCENSYSQTSNIVYLNSYNLGYAWSDSIHKGIKRSLNQKNINLFVECLDAKRFGNEKFEVFTDYFIKKYKNIRIDAVITSDNDALDYAFKYGNTVFQNAPVVFCGISDPEDYNFEGTRIYGFTESTDPRKTVSVLTRLLPQAKSLLYITDNTTSGVKVISDYEEIQKLYPSIKINFLSDIDVDELTEKVKKGDQGDIVYLLRINRDKYGNLLDYLDFFKKIADASPNPVFADDEAIIGHGVVGGNANRGFTQGYRSGLLVLQLLQNNDRSNFNHVTEIQDEYIFDYKKIKKFGINPESLPKKSIIINTPIVEYLKYIIFLVIVVAILSAIVIVLVILNRKRLMAEKKVSEQLTMINDRNVELEFSHNQLSILYSELEEANAQHLKLNITLNEAKQKAEESEKLKSSFLANLSHEIRTPLNAILGFSSLLNQSGLKAEAKRNYFNIIQSNSDSLLVLIDDILDFSRIEAGQVNIYTEPVVVNDIFDELFSFFKQKNNVNVQLIISDFAINNQLILITDKIRFRQILSNLLTNAFKFTETGFIELGFEVINNELRFYVKDTGVGIDKKYHHSIFERFRKVEENKTKIYSGSGLGLAICKKLTELLGGNIWVEGEPGIGSTFYFTHPDFTIKNKEPETRSFLKQSAEYNWNGIKIAVAEDEDTNYLLLEQIITSHGAELIRFSDGLSIVKYFSIRKNPETRLILMDIKMPELDGFQAMERIKKIHPHLIFIAQTAYAMSEDIATIKEKGFDDFITKPINSDLLKEKIDKYLCSLPNV